MKKSREEISINTVIDWFDQKLSNQITLITSNQKYQKVTKNNNVK